VRKAPESRRGRNCGLGLEGREGALYKRIKRERLSQFLSRQGREEGRVTLDRKKKEQSWEKRSAVRHLLGEWRLRLHLRDGSKGDSPLSIKTKGERSKKGSPASLSKKQGGESSTPRKRGALPAKGRAKCLLRLH